MLFSQKPCIAKRVSNALALPSEELDGKVPLKEIVLSDVVERFKGIFVEALCEGVQKVWRQLGFVCCISV